MKKHYKKLTQPYFDHVRLGIKTFELRKNDCDYQVGDIVILQEYIEIMSCYKSGSDSPKTVNLCREMSLTDRKVTARITYMLEDYEGLQDGYCILGIEVLEK